MSCPAVAYRPELQLDSLPCGLPINHDGNHFCQLSPGHYFSWSAVVELIVIPTPAPAPVAVPFDRSREEWFTGYCENLFCDGQIRGRSLDGGPIAWRHEIRVLDNDHEAVGGVS